MAKVPNATAAYEDILRQETDQRDEVQKKTFTKWVNKHIIKVHQMVGDLYEDLRSGRILVVLLELLSGEALPPCEKGNMRFHRMQNVQNALNFLRHKGIKLVNIHADEIVDGNPKLTLGLVWTIILHFQISDVLAFTQDSHYSIRDSLLLWCQRTCSGYPGVHIKNFTTSWRDGLAFNAILHRHSPHLIDYRAVQQRRPLENLENAFTIAERDFGVTRLIEPSDIDVDNPDEKVLMTYIASLRERFPEIPSIENSMRDSERQARYEEYQMLASSLINWLRQATNYLNSLRSQDTYPEMKKVLTTFNRFRMEEVPLRQRDVYKLGNLWQEMSEMGPMGIDSSMLDSELHLDNINRLWERYAAAEHDKEMELLAEMQRLERLQKLAEKIQRDCKITEDKIEDIDIRISKHSINIDKLRPADAQEICDKIRSALGKLDGTVQEMFADVQTLKDGRHEQADPLYRRVARISQRLAGLYDSLQTKLEERIPEEDYEKLNRPLMNGSAINGVGEAVEPMDVSVDYDKLNTSAESSFFSKRTPRSFNNIQQCLEWVQNRQRDLDHRGYGNDLEGVRDALQMNQQSHREIMDFQREIDRCANFKSSVAPDDIYDYNQQLQTLESAYAKLVNTSETRDGHLKTLLGFMEAATQEMIWLNEKEEAEIARDWCSRTANISELEDYHEVS